MSCDKAKTTRADGLLFGVSSDRATDRATLSALLLPLAMGSHLFDVICSGLCLVGVGVVKPL